MKESVQVVQWNGSSLPRNINDWICVTDAATTLCSVTITITRLQVTKSSNSPNLVSSSPTEQAVCSSQQPSQTLRFMTFVPSSWFCVTINCDGPHRATPDDVGQHQTTSGNTRRRRTAPDDVGQHQTTSDSTRPEMFDYFAPTSTMSRIKRS